MSKTVIEGAESLRAHSGQELGVSGWHEMKFEDIVRFAEVSLDRQWIHIDRERIARESPFGAPIAHGYFTLSLIGGLFFEVAEIRGFKLVVNYGLNKVRFPAPVKEGARYRLRAQLGEVKPVTGGFEAVIPASIEVEGQEKPACVAEIVFRFLQ